MATPHNEAERGDFADIVLMPGDPMRAKLVAETYLEDCKLVNKVRGMLGYTGTYHGKRVTVMASGMGQPSIGIYSYELFNFYDVENIIRIGSAGAFSDDVHVRDIILAQGASTNSNYADQFGIPGTFAPLAEFGLLRKAVETGEKLGYKTVVGNVLSSDVFYHADPTFNDKWKRMGVLAVEMESAALYLNATYAGKKALGIFTVSDHIYTGEALSAQERQDSFKEMMELALEVAPE